MTQQPHLAQRCPKKPLLDMRARKCTPYVCNLPPLHCALAGFTNVATEIVCAQRIAQRSVARAIGLALFANTIFQHPDVGIIIAFLLG